MPKPILLVHYGKQEWIRGSERCLIDLAYCLDKSRYAPVLWCDTQIMANAFRALDIPIYVDEFPILFGYNSPKLSVNATQSLVTKGCEIIQQHNIALIHSNSAAPNQWLASIANLLCIPLVTQLHARYVFSDRLTLRVHQADHIIGVSQPVINQVLEDGINKDKCHVVPNGIDTQRLLSQDSTNVPMVKDEQQPLKLITVGSLIERKGMDILLHTVALLKTRSIPVQLTIIGDGEEKSALLSLRKKLDLEQDVYFLGEKSNAFAYLREHADIFISGAREEVFGLVFAEAGLAGLPCIAPNVGGISSVVQHLKTGVLVDTPCAKLLADACQTLYGDQVLCQELGNTGKNHILQKFTIEKNTQNISDIYEKAISEGRRKDTSWFSQCISTFSIIKSYILKKCKTTQSTIKKMVILDTIPFNGGSKIATQRFLATLAPDVKVHILSCQPIDWSKSSYPTYPLYPLPYFQNAESGWRYFIKHSFIALQLLTLILKLRNVQIVMGASLPSNDLALLLIKKLTKNKWLQFIHGNLYPSRLNARLLQHVDYLYYLPSTEGSIKETLERNASDLEQLSTTIHIESFINGIDLPLSAPTIYKKKQPRVLWAASALRWKGLDNFLTALNLFSDATRPVTDICFIRPRDTKLAVSEVNVPINNVYWYEAPTNLSEIRDHCQIFVSTSHKEPFGLSILEALASAMCVCIPADNAYWDRELIHGKNCIKYQANNSQDLFNTLNTLINSPETVAKIGAAGFQQAQKYCAHKTYSGIRQTVERYTL